MKWIYLAQNSDQWWAVMDTVMDLLVRQMEGNFSVEVVSFVRRTLLLQQLVNIMWYFTVPTHNRVQFLASHVLYLSATIS